MKFLQYLRMRRGFTQRELAKKLGFDSTSLCRYERGIDPIPNHHAQRLERFFGKGWTADKLLTQVPEVTPDMVKPAA